MKLFNKKIFGSGNTTLIISNKEMNDTMERIKPYKESGLLNKFFKEISNNLEENQPKLNTSYREIYFLGDFNINLFENRKYVFINPPVITKT